MTSQHFRMLSELSDTQLRTICRNRRILIPSYLEEDPDSRIALLKTMQFHLEDHGRLTDTLADLDSSCLLALRHLADGQSMDDLSQAQILADLGLILPCLEGWKVPEAVQDALEDFDDSALSFERPEVLLPNLIPYQLALALQSILMRCMSGIKVLKGGLPSKKEVINLLKNNAVLCQEQDATLLFALLYRLGLLWNRECRVETLLPAVLSHPPRWISERCFAALLEQELSNWEMPPAQDRRFIMQHLLQRSGQTLDTHAFLSFLQTLHPLDLDRTQSTFLPFLNRIGLLHHNGSCLRLSAHGEALCREYLLRDASSTEAHWEPFARREARIVQPTLEILTPTLQNTHDLLRLAQIADVEGIDTICTFRISRESILRAVEQGLEMKDIRKVLGEPEQLPQPLLHLLDDLEKHMGEIEIADGIRLIKTRSAGLVDELCLRPELAPLKLEPLSEKVVEVHGEAPLWSLLKNAGYLPKIQRYLPLSLDRDGELYLWALASLAFVNGNGLVQRLEPVRQRIQQALERLKSEDMTLYQEMERRVAMLHFGGENQSPDETHRILEYAGTHTLMVELSYLPPASHRTQLRRVTPREIQADHLRAFCHLHQEEMRFRLARIQGVRLLDERGWRPQEASA